MAQSSLLVKGVRCCPGWAPGNQARNNTFGVDKVMQKYGVVHHLHTFTYTKKVSTGVNRRSGHSRISAMNAPPISAKQGEESAPVATDSSSRRIAQKILTGTLAAALILLPANGGNSMEAYTASPVSLPLAAAVTESVSADSAADLFSQLKGYNSARHEASATGKGATAEKASGEDPITAVVESVKVAEDLDVTKLPEVHGPAKVNIAKDTQVPKTPPVTAEPSATASSAKPELAEGVQSNEGQTRVGALLERLKKGADAGRSGIAGTLAESKQLLGLGSAKPEAAEGVQASEGQTKVGAIFERLKKGADAGRSAVAGPLAESKELLGVGRSRVEDLVGRVKEGVAGKIGGGEKSAPETLPVETKAAPAEANGSPGGLKGWFGGKSAPETLPGETKAALAEASGSPGGLKGWFDSWTGKPSESKVESRGLLLEGAQTAKGVRGFFQSKPPPKEEKTGLAGAWESFTSLDFLPDNVKGGALTVKSAVSFVLTVLSLVLSVFAKVLGLAADLIGIIARGL